MQRNYFFLYAQVSQTDFAQNKNGSITAAVPIYNVTLFIFAFKLPEPAIGLIEVGPRLIVESHVAIIFHDP